VLPALARRDRRLRRLLVAGHCRRCPLRRLRQPLLSRRPSRTPLCLLARSEHRRSADDHRLHPDERPLGHDVTITGSHFTGATNVTFDNVDATYTVDGDTQITATVPAGAGSGFIAVSNPSGTAVSADTFAVTNPDFRLSADPTSRTVTAGTATSYTITVTPTYGFTGTVALSLSGLPAGTTAAFTPASTAGTSTLTVQTSRKATTGAAILTITGESGNLTHTTSVTLQITRK
jgi:hypothetical protein